jgi:hypothetical protein
MIAIPGAMPTSIPTIRHTRLIGEPAGDAPCAQAAPIKTPGMTMSAVSKNRDTAKAWAPFGKVLPAPITDTIPPIIKAPTKSPRSIVSVGMFMATPIDKSPFTSIHRP